MTKTGTKVVLNLSAPDNMKRVQPGDLIAHLRSFQGGLEKSDLAGKVSTAYTVIEPLATADPNFFRWVLKSPPYIQTLSSSLEQLRDGQSVKFGDFAAIPLPLPPIDEQRRIADFLDDRVARIDQIIAGRLVQVELAFSWQQSRLVAQLLSEGDPTAPLRHLGVRVTTGPFGTVFSASEYVDGGVPMINPTHIKDGELLPDPSHSVSLATAARLSRHQLRDGDLVVSRKGDIGRTAVVLPYQDGWICGSDSIALHASGSKILPELLDLLLKLDATRDQLLAESNAATMPSLSEGNLLSLRVPAIDVPDQVQRIEDARHTRASTQVAVRETRRSIELLQEYKRSLITAAVTGEFDVATAGNGIPG